MEAGKVGQENNTEEKEKKPKAKKHLEKFEQNSLERDVVQRTKDTKIIGLSKFSSYWKAGLEFALGVLRGM